MIAPVKKTVNHLETVTSMRELRVACANLLRGRCVFVRGNSAIENEFALGYCLYAVRILLRQNGV